MRVCGFAAEGLRSERRIHETFPSKELQDYWASRPKYEDVDHKSGDFVSGSSKGTEEGASASGAGDGQSYQDWLAAQKSEDKEEPPPPPYSLEADEASETQPRAATPAQAAPTPAPVPAATVASASSSAATSASSSVPTSGSYQPPVSGASGPPPINSNSRPQQTPNVPTEHSPSSALHSIDSTASHLHQPYNTSANLPPGGRPPSHELGAMNLQQSYNVSTEYPHNSAPPRQDAMVSLTNEFGRHGISPSGSGRVTSASPPPLHPAHPAAGSSYSQTRPQSPHSRPQQYSRPTSQSGYTHPSSSPVLTPVSPTTGQSSGTPSQGQWPPPEWGVGAASQQRPPTQSYPGQMPPTQSHSIGANLSRPHTITASSYTSSSTSSSLRPHASISGQSGRPHQYQTPPDTPGGTQGSFGAPFPGNSSYQPPGSSSSTPYTPPFAGSGVSGYTPGPPLHVPGSPYFPTSSISPYPPASTYPGQAGSTYPGQSGYMPPPISGQGYPNTHGHSSPPHSPSPGSPSYGMSSYPGQTQPYNPGHGSSSYPGQYPGHSQGPNDSAGGFHFPQAQGGDHFNIPQPQAHVASYAPSYIGQQSSHQSSIPTPATGGWYPGNSTPPTGPPMPSRESI
jgi:hypothetical protein